MHKYKNNFEGLNKFIFVASNGPEQQAASSEQQESAQEPIENNETRQRDLYQNVRELSNRYEQYSFESKLTKATELTTLSASQIQLPDGTSSQLVNYAINNNLVNLEDYCFALGLQGIATSAFDGDNIPVIVFSNLRSSAEAANNNFEEKYGDNNNTIDAGSGNSLIRVHNGNLNSTEETELRSNQTTITRFLDYTTTINQALQRLETGLENAQNLFRTETQIAQVAQTNTQYQENARIIENRGNTEGIRSNGLENMSDLTNITATVLASSIKVRDRAGTEIRGERYRRGEEVTLAGAPVEININGTMRKFGKVANSGEPGKYVALGFLEPSNISLPPTTPTAAPRRTIISSLFDRGPVS